MPLTKSSNGATSCSKPVTVQELKDHSTELAKEMGLGQECIQQASDQYSASEHEFTAQAEAKVAFGLGSVSAAATKNDFATASNSAMMQKGCGTFNLSAAKILEAHNAMSCELRKSSQKTSATASASARINIKAERTLAKQKELDKALIEFTDKAKPILRDYTSALAEDDKDLKKIAIKAIAAENKESIDTYRDLVSKMEDNAAPPKIVMRGGSISLKVDSKMNVVSNITDKQKAAIRDQMKAIAQATAENDIQKKTGIMSLSSNTKNVVRNQVNEQSSSMDEHIDNMTESTKLSVSADGVISIVGDNIDMTDVEINENVQATLMLQKATSRSVTLGKQSAAQIINKLNSKTSDKLEASGLKELAEARGKARAKAIEKEGDLIKNQFDGMSKFAEATTGTGAMLYVIIILIVLGSLGKLTNIGIFPWVTPYGILMNLLLYLIVAIIIYLIVAKILGLWPFNKSDKFMVKNNSYKDGKPFYSGTAYGAVKLNSSKSSTYVGEGKSKKTPKY